ncbi:Metallo-dependent hydrolase [Phlegmacium glaucopus]|nr:Metallo-dependent hydrolase [Phlegmacium glaucopus]
MAFADSHGTRSIFYGAVINPISLTCYSILPQCLLSIDPSGRIEWMIGNIERHELQETLTSKGCVDIDIVILGDGQFLMPGFIDTHTHAPQFPIMGTGNQYVLLEWLKTLVFPMERQFKNEHFARKAYESVVRRILDFGTTTCCYYSTLHLDATKILADITHAYGQRAFIGKCNMNRNSPDDYIEPSTEVSVENTHSLISYIRGLDHHSNHPGQEPLVQPVLTPRFALSCTEDLLTSLCSLAASDPTLRIQTHISENKIEIVDTLKAFPEAKSYAAVYDMFGLLRNNTILAHAVHLTEDEVELIKERGVGISHCPTSNFNLNSGIAPIGYYLDRGIKVGLGTDVSGGYSPSMITAIQNASIASKALSFNRECPCPSSHPASESHDHHHDLQFTNRPLKISALLYLATVGGAAVCGIEKQVGSFDVGKSFDALLVSVGEDNLNPGLWALNSSRIPTHGTAADGAAHSEGWLEKKKEIVDGWLERFLHCGDDRNIERVYVQGRLVGGRTFNA